MRDYGTNKFFDAEIIGAVEKVTGKRKHIKLTYSQMVLILEALQNYKKDLEEGEEIAVKSKEKKFLKLKVENIDMLDEFIETGLNYNFDKAINKCINRRKIHKSDEEGMETFGWMETEMERSMREEKEL